MYDFNPPVLPHTDGQTVGTSTPPSAAPKAPISAAHEGSDGTSHTGAADANVSNVEFANAIFSSVPEGVSLAVCSKPGNPKEGPWPPMGPECLPDRCPAGNNNYINCGSFKVEPGRRLHARKDNAAGVHFLLLDDLGSKVPLERVNGFPLSWVIETSPDNYQCGIIFDRPRPVAEADKLLKAVIGGHLCDPDATGAATRWARLPVGINGKPEHRAADGSPFQCRLLLWKPDRRYSPQEIVAALALEPAAGPTGSEPAQTTRNDASPVSPVPLKKIAALLEYIDANCGYRVWVSVLMAIFHATQGDDAGLELADVWSGKGASYKGRSDIEMKWRSFRLNVPNPVTVATLVKLARDAGADTPAIMQGGEQFDLCDYEIVEPGRADPVKPAHDTPLRRYSLLGRSEELEKQMVEQVAIFGDVILQGQASVIYAKPNTGKTLLMLYLIVEAIRAKRIDPSKLFYINMDDNSNGLAEKNRIADEFGFHMLADGHCGFDAQGFRAAVEEMNTTDTARGVIIVLDTLRKFVDTMSKDKSAAFANVVRRFVGKGGTVIALAHTNKNPGADGKSIYGGTTDIMDNFDCAHMLDALSQQPEADRKVVVFENTKRRGNVAPSASYSYPVERDISYADLVRSVHEVTPEQRRTVQQAADRRSDDAVITAVIACIDQGIDTKMALANAVADRANVSKRIALSVIDRYAGDDPAVHRWIFAVRSRGAKVYSLLPLPASDSAAVEPDS